VRRIVAVSSDPEVAHAIDAALSSIGIVAPLTVVDPTVVADLYVIDVAGDPGPDPGVTCPVIAIVPRGELAAAVAVLQAWERVAGVAVAGELGGLAALATRILDEATGLATLVPPNTEIRSRVVADFDGKLACMAEVAAFADAAGVTRNREAIEQCLDEMLMNALYDAPVDARGKRVFAGVPTKDRITWRTGETVTVQYACDGKRFALAVRDAFGTLERRTVVGYLNKSLHDPDRAVDRKVSGAGLGLYLMVTSSTQVHFHVVPGVATEVACVFDLQARKLELEQLACVIAPVPADRAATTTHRVPTPARRRRTLVRAVAGFAAVAVIALAIVFVPPLFSTPPTARLAFTTIPPGAAIELDGRSLGIADGTLAVADLAIDRSYAVVARLDGYEDKRVSVEPHAGANAITIALAARPRLELDSQPSSATVEIDRKPMGSTPLVLTTLAAGSTVTIVFARAGYRPATARLLVPAAGEVKRHVQPLERSEDLVAVRFVSTPPGAEVVRTGQAPTTDRTYTPAELFVEVDKLHRFTLTMPRHIPVLIEPFTVSRGTTGLEKQGTLVPGFTLRLEGTGKATVARVPHCGELALPADCVLAPGTYVVERGTDKRAVTIEDADLVLKL
jgi:hypothetical protein